METRKKTYNKPLLQSEAFVPNEYVAACVAEIGVTQYYLACDSPTDGADGHQHRTNGCKDPDAYTVDIDRNNHISLIKETNGWTLFGDPNAFNIKIKVGDKYVDASEVEIDLNGEYDLQWQTKWGYNDILTHYGDFKRTTPINVNMS